MYCMSCGAVLPENAAFCRACGAELREGREPEQARLHELRCSSCGSAALKKIPGKGYRCEHCGTLLYADRQEPAAKQEAAEAEVAALLAEAASLEEGEDFAGALRTLSRAAELAPEDNSVLLRLGRAYWRLGFLEKAMEYYRTAEELYPDDPAVYNNIGSVFFKSGQYEQARAQYEKAIALLEAKPASASVGDAAVFYGNYAYSLGKLGDRKRAKQYLSLAKKKGYSTESINKICEELHLLRFLI